MGMLFEVGLAGRVLAWAGFSTPVKVRLIARVVVGLVELGGCGCDAKLMCVRVGVGRDLGRQGHAGSERSINHEMRAHYHSLDIGDYALEPANRSAQSEGERGVHALSCTMSSYFCLICDPS
jgi:hypothetical protein